MHSTVITKVITTEFTISPLYIIIDRTEMDGTIDINPINNYGAVCLK